MIIASLAEGTSEVVGYLPSEDCLRTLEVFRKMGVSIETGEIKGQPTLWIQGGGLGGLLEPTDVMDCGNSGTTLRLMTGLLAGCPFFSVLTGDRSLRSRPMRRVIEPLRTMGAEVMGRAAGTLAPLAIFGKKLSGIAYPMPIPSAQVKSAILLAGLTASGVTSVTEAIPSRDHTERMLRYFEGPITVQDGKISVTGHPSFRGKKIEIPGDISSAAFFMVAGVILPNMEIRLNRVGVNPTRTGIVEVLQQMGADMTVTPLPSLCGEPMADITVRSSKLRGVEVAQEMIPRIIDEFPVLAVAAAVADGTTTIRHAAELRVKESDRIEKMAALLNGMGVGVEVFSDGLKIKGVKKLKGGLFQTASDHRIAMAAMIAGLVADGGNRIDDRDCVNTSFPQFFDLLASLTGG